MELLGVFEWCEASWLGQFVRTSIWMFPVIEASHLLGLASLGGAVLMVDLRMLGLALRDQPVAALAHGAQRWLRWSIGYMLASGFLLFMSEAVKCYHNPAFWVKILTLPFAIAFTLLVRQPAAMRATEGATVRTRAVALASIALWLTVAAGGRWIGLSS